jgi:hypothetical protein
MPEGNNNRTRLQGFSSKVPERTSAIHTEEQTGEQTGECEGRRYSYREADRCEDHSTALTTLKMAVSMPMPSASVQTAMRKNPGVLTSWRNAEHSGPATWPDSTFRSR